MAIAKFDGFEIPKVYVLDEELIEQADVGRTIDGTERRDVVAVKRTWRVETRPVLPSEIAALENHLAAILWGYGDWWIDTFGSETNTTRARIDASSWRKGRPLDLPGRRSLSFTVIEQ